MRVLILGGTVFLGRALAGQALAAGHEVVCAARGSSGDPVAGVQFVRADRDEPDGLRGVAGDFDLVVDVARRPDHVRHAIAALTGRVGHLVFVSSISAYADQSVPGQRVNETPLLEPAELDDEDPVAQYGRCKVTCEQLYTEAFSDALLCRAGLIVGAEDPTGRFTYWAHRGVRGGEILVPGTPDDLVQLIDVRDLAAWLLDAGQRGVAGAFDGTGPAMSRREFMVGVTPGSAQLTFVPQEFLLEHDVNPWNGPRSLPVWLPTPEYAGILSRDVTATLEAGLRYRPLAETAEYALAAEVGENGLTEAEEAELLRAFHAR